MQLTFGLSGDERHACRRAAVYVRGIAAGLRGSTDKDAMRCETYAATLTELAEASDTVTLDGEQKIHVEQGAFLLEGVRNGLDNAELDTAAEVVERDIQRLTDIALRFNTEAGRQI